jgi:cystathionine beta-lyase/cystathionine gamma-synthase
MAAISTTLLNYLKPGGKIVVPMELYSSTFALLDNLSPKLSVKVEKVWPSAESIVKAVDSSTSIIFVEVITNPTNKVIDLEYLHKHLDLLDNNPNTYNKVIPTKCLELIFLLFKIWNKLVYLMT